MSRRIVLHLHSATKKGVASEVEFRLAQEGDKVRLTLTHRKIPDRAFALGVSGGWHSHIWRSCNTKRKVKELPPAFWDVWRETDGVLMTSATPD